MKHRSFDHFVKEQLSGMKPEVHPGIWEKIAAEKDKKKPITFGWFTGLNTIAAILVLSVVSGTVYYATHHHALQEKTADVAVQHENKKDNSNVIPSSPFVNNDQVAPSADNQISKNNNSGSSTITNPDHYTKTQNILNIPAKSSISIFNPERTNNDLASANTINDNTQVNSDFSLTGFASGMSGINSRSSFNPRLKVPFMLRGLSIPCPAAEENAAGNKRYVEFYAGPDYAFRSINDYDNGSYTQDRKESTKTAFSYSAGLRYTKVWGSGLSIRTGINYSRINERFKQEKGHVTQNVYVTNDSGDTTGTYTVTGTQYKKSTNKFTTIDIPITAGYEMGNGRLHANINAGVMVNLISRQKGFVLDKSGNAVDISSGAIPTVYQYKKNAGVSLTGAVSVYYKLNDRMHIMAEPYVRYSLSPVTKSELSLKQKYHTAGVRLGVRMDL